MKHQKYFEDFLAEVVNLNETRLERLNRSTSAVVEYLSKSLDSYEKTERQGSYALRTIIKPVNGREFDADVLLFMEYDPDKEPKDYINAVYDCLRQNDTYREKSHRKTRCVNVDYADEFHLDIVPCLTDGEYRYICNRNDNEFEITDGTGYRDWFNGKTRITNGNLKRVTRLLKYLRDHKGNFSIKSVLLTTLIGENVFDEDEDSENFKDIPTSLKTVSNRINDFLQTNPNMPEVCNPVLPEESFTRHWDQDKYRHFRDLFDTYNSKVNEAFESTDHNASVKKWRELFGDKFGELKDVTTSAAAIVTPRRPYAC